MSACENFLKYFLEKRKKYQQQKIILRFNFFRVY